MLVYFDMTLDTSVWLNFIWIFLTLIAVTINAGWKINNNTLCNEGETGDSFIQCYERKIYNAENDLQLAATSHDGVTITNNSIEINPYHVGHGVIQSLKLKPGVISHRISSTLFLWLNNSIRYNILITDTRLQFFTESPDTVPRVKVPLKKGHSVIIYLKVHWQQKSNIKL